MMTKDLYYQTYKAETTTETKDTTTPMMKVTSMQQNIDSEGDERSSYNMMKTLPKHAVADGVSLLIDSKPTQPKKNWISRPKYASLPMRKERDSKNEIRMTQQQVLK
jgi:hypothetical protein